MQVSEEVKLQCLNRILSGQFSILEILHPLNAFSVFIQHTSIDKEGILVMDAARAEFRSGKMRPGKLMCLGLNLANINEVVEEGPGITTLISYDMYLGLYAHNNPYRTRLTFKA